MVRNERHDLSEHAVERITAQVRSLADDGVERGIDLSRPMRCDSCGQERSPRGAAAYGSYALCNDCLLQFTLQLASSDVDTIAEFMTKRDDGLPPSDIDTARTRGTLGVHPASRDTLMASNEPI